MNTKTIPAVCDNCGNKTMVKVPKFGRMTEFHAANCDNCRENWEKEMDQVMKSVIGQAFKQ